jgi:hypothetical protein
VGMSLLSESGLDDGDPSDVPYKWASNSINEQCKLG